MPRQRSLTDRQEQEVSRRHQAGATMRALSADYKVAHSTIYRVIKRANSNSQTINPQPPLETKNVPEPAPFLPKPQSLTRKFRYWLISKLQD